MGLEGHAAQPSRGEPQPSVVPLEGEPFRNADAGLETHPDLVGLLAADDFRKALDPHASAQDLEDLARQHIGDCGPECCYGGDLSWLIFIVAAHPNLSWSAQRFIFDFDTKANGDYAKALAESLLNNPNCDPGIIETLSNIYFDDWLVDLIYHHPNTPQSVLEAYAEDFDLPLR